MGGAERLLRELVRRGIDERALMPAAAIAIVMELDAAGRMEALGVVSDLARQ